MRSAITMSAGMRTATWGLGPEHDWSSHAADAFGYLAISYQERPAASAHNAGSPGAARVPRESSRAGTPESVEDPSPPILAKNKECRPRQLAHATSGLA